MRTEELIYNSNVATALLIQATNFAQSNGFTIEQHRDDNEESANFANTFRSIEQEIIARIKQGTFYASIYFNADLNQFSIDSFESHDEMLHDYLDGFADDPTIPKALIMASFTKHIKVDGQYRYFTLEIVLG